MQDTHTELHLATCKSFLKLIFHEVLDKHLVLVNLSSNECMINRQLAG